MARIDGELRVTTSVLDRLLDFDPKQSKDGPRSRTTSIRELKQSVMRDLEWLLNTRHGIKVPEGLEETKRSVVFYGLPDFTGLSIANNAELKQLTKHIEDAINFFEPRFLDLKIIFEPITPLERQIRFRVEARLDAEPTPEPITFDTVMNSGTGNFSVIEK